MTLLQPTDVPSMDGINDAITSEISDAIAEAHEESALYTGNAIGPDLGGWIRCKLILGGRLGLVWFNCPVVNAIAVPADGNSADSNRMFPTTPALYRPAQTINVPGRAINAAGGVPCWVSFNQSGYTALGRFEATGSAYNIAAGDTLQGQMIYIPNGQDF